MRLVSTLFGDDRSRTSAWTVIGTVVLCFFLSAPAMAAPADSTSQSNEPTPVPVLLLLAPGQIQTVPVSNVERVAIGDPELVDATIISPKQILIQAKKVGSTNLIVWDARGERQTTVNVVDPQPEAISQELTQFLQQQGVVDVTVKRQGSAVFLVGEVDTKAQADGIEQMASALAGKVVSLVTVKPAMPPRVEPAPLVKLSVQVLDINRSDLERLGVKWPESIGFTEQSLAVGPGGEIKPNEALVGRPGSLADRVGEAFRIGRLARLPNSTFSLNLLLKQGKARLLAEPKLVTASGKEAASFIGVEVPVISATSFGSNTSSVSATIEYRKTGVLLKMTPKVQNEEREPKITTVIESEVSSIDKTVGLNIPVGSQTILVPGFKVRKANSEVTTTSGETIILAGLLEVEDTNEVSQVPGLGSMPVLGRLFRSPESVSTRRELVITVTPELVGDAAKDTDHQMALEQALAVAEVTASVDDPRLRYALQIQDKIAKVLRYPQREKELNIEGTVKLKLHLFADGTLGRAMVSESSGIESLDLEAVKAAESQAPYPGFPSQLTARELWLEIPVIFRP